MPRPPVQTPVCTEPEPEPITWDDVKAYIPHAYLTGAALFLLWNLLSYRVYTAKILRTAKEADTGTQQIYEAVCRKKGLSRLPVLLVSPDVNSPAAFGLIRRRIVLPEIDFTENGLAGTLSHEVTHCRRGDLWIKAVCLLARALHWFNPLVHLAAFRCEMEMELSCDESVLSGCDENTRAAYGEVMLDIIKRCRRNRGALTTHFNPKKNAVKARFTNILYGSGKKHGLWLIAVCLVLCLIAGAIFGQPKLTLDNIQEQKGFTILSQETRELTLTLPMEQLPAYDEIASAENAHLELDDIPVFTTDTTEVFVHTTGVSGHSPEGVEKDVLYLGFDIRHTLTESGTIYTGTRVMNESGEHSYTSAFHVTQDTLQEYNRGIRWMGRGPSDQFHLYVDAALYTALQGDVEIGITLNEIVYARGNEVKIYGRENSESTADDSGAEQTGEFPTMEAYVTDRMAKETTAQYFAAEPDGSFSNKQ
ncbi:MAG: M56 family metallopeptidase, partial [Clostridia bacterium]|nr:M56 family metallopeptidase [Clostridia bacterium]